MDVCFTFCSGGFQLRFLDSFSHVLPWRNLNVFITFFVRFYYVLYTFLIRFPSQSGPGAWTPQNCPESNDFDWFPEGNLGLADLAFLGPWASLPSKHFLYLFFTFFVRFSPFMVNVFLGCFLHPRTNIKTQKKPSLFLHINNWNNNLISHNGVQITFIWDMDNGYRDW